MTTSSVIRRLLGLSVIAAITTLVPLMAQNVSDGELLLREALHKQQVEGDLPGAIKIYQQIASAPNRNRSVVARGLGIAARSPIRQRTGIAVSGRGCFDSPRAGRAK